ncbi:hypothetical protein MB84_31340 (plasmid) [Pandoraea oxalativorans]|uniref:Major facilitator superfamily (MFS) profile domain-containing protein n=1 Tax=Pandoraea oxalativorans TaxID=573737 RepID=A0A192B104_9BURK|nr:hypothetical protein MB84_31340 [Pandoraea oxalativorans]
MWHPPSQWSWSDVARIAAKSAATLALATALGDTPTLSPTFMRVATAMMWAAYTVFWTLPPESLKGDGAAGGIALIDTLGRLGGLVSPTIIGGTQSVTGNPHARLHLIVAPLAVGAITLIRIRPAHTADA